MNNRNRDIKQIKDFNVLITQKGVIMKDGIKKLQIINRRTENRIC